MASLESSVSQAAKCIGEQEQEQEQGNLQLMSSLQEQAGMIHNWLYNL